MPEGIHRLVDEKFLLSTEDDELLCYDALTGKLLWKQVYTNVFQELFRDLDWIGTTTVLRYGNLHLAIDLADGRELWRTWFKYNTEILEKGGWNFGTLSKQQVFFALMEDDQLGIFRFSDGRQVFKGEGYEINSDLIEKGRSYFYASPDQRFIIFLLDEHIAVVDVAEKKELKRIPITYDTDYPSIIPTQKGCALLGEKKIVFFADSTASLVEVPVPVSDLRTYNIMEVGGKEIFFAGLENGMFAVDLEEGKVLWQSRQDDPNFEGYAHRYIAVQDGKLLVSYSNAGIKIGGTNISLLCLNPLTGEVDYRTPPFFKTKVYLATFVRKMQKALSAVSSTSLPFGYDNIGFDYTISNVDGALVFTTLSSAQMVHPQTDEEGVEGIVMVDPATGKILFADYVYLNDDSGIPIFVTQPVFSGTQAILVGEEAIAVYNLAEKKRMWLSKETLKGKPAEMMIAENTLYVKFGLTNMAVSLSPPQGIFGTLTLEVKPQVNVDPYGFAAYNLADGKLLWRIETAMDPGFLTPQFSLENNYDSLSRRLYFADESYLFALQFRPDGGKYGYVVELTKIGVGKMPFDKTYAVQKFPIGTKTEKKDYYYGFNVEVTTTTTTISETKYNRFLSQTEGADAAITYEGYATVWGAVAKKCLRTVFADAYIFTMGRDGVALLDAADGKARWVHRWDYDQDNVEYVPSIHNGKLVYCIDRQLTCVDLETGEVLWKQEEGKRPLFFVSPDERYIFTINEEIIRGYEIEKQQ